MLDVQQYATGFTRSFHAQGQRIAGTADRIFRAGLVRFEVTDPAPWVFPSHSPSSCKRRFSS
jgi:hypothetical protein